MVPGDHARHRRPNAELFAQLSRLGELLLGLALILGLLTNPAAVGSVLLSLALLFSAGGPRLGTGLGAPEFLSTSTCSSPWFRWSSS